MKNNELKLLNIYKILATTATNLVGIFIPAMVYDITGKVWLAILYLCASNFLAYGIIHIIKDFLQRKPQLALLLRTIPILCMEIFTVFIYNIPVISIVFIGLSMSWDMAIESIACDSIFNYNADTSSAKSMSILYTFEKAGYVIATVLGGLFLDHLNLYILIAVSVSLYLVSCVPLLRFYIKNRGNTTYNHDAISNAFIESKLIDEKQKKEKKELEKYVLRRYRALTFLNYGLENSYVVLTFMMFVSFGSYTMIGVADALFSLFYGLGIFAVGRCDERWEIERMVTIFAIVSGVILVINGFVINSGVHYIVPIILLCVQAFIMAFPMVFCTNRMIMKGQILGVSNKCVVYNQTMLNLNAGITYIFGMFLPLWTMPLVAGLMVELSGFSIEKIEEQTRKKIIRGMRDINENNKEV